MNEYDNVKEALKALIKLAEGGEIYVQGMDGKRVLASQEDVLEIVRDRAYKLADLLGMEDLYLKDVRTRRDQL